MSRQLLARARAGDGDAFGELVEPFRHELLVHCYRILGSAADAEDALQETLMGAWRGLNRFEGRASLRSWLYRIATNKCLNTLRAGKSRPSFSPSPPSAELPAPSRQGEPVWLDPYPDDMLGLAPGEVPDEAPGPEARYEARESVSLAFMAALQHLPPTQRAALILRDVLGFRAAEAADILDCTVDTVNGLVKRARASIDRQVPPGSRDQAPLPGSARERDIASRFADAYERGDVDTIIGLLTEDAKLTMPPLPFEYHGRDSVAGFLAAVHPTAPYRLIPTRANGQPAFGCYLPDGAAPVVRANGLLVLTLDGDRISALTRFLDNSVIGWFGLPRTLPDEPA
jgi:RNA polymerase sigma-70 factor (TIGR02960 family)